ncbi:unnamed protein product [Closterium sp. NIES-53]
MSLDAFPVVEYTYYPLFPPSPCEVSKNACTTHGCRKLNLWPPHLTLPIPSHPTPSHATPLHPSHPPPPHAMAVRFYGRSASSSAAPTIKTDLDVLRESYRFIRSEADDAEGTWEQRLAKRYYDKLFKEYCVGDMSRYKENKIGLRWRTHAEVLQGKGQFVCGTKGYSSSSRSQSDISGSGDRSDSSDFSNTSGSKRGAAESDSDEGNNAKRHKRGRSERARKEELTGRGVRHGAKEEEAKLRRERQEQKCQKAGGKEAGQARGMGGASRESGAGGAGEGTEAGQDGRVHGAAGAGKSAADGHENARAGEGHGERQGQGKGQGQGQGQGSGGRLADGKGKNVVVQGGTLPANEEVWQQPAMVAEPSREEEFDEYFQGMFL